MNDEVCPILNCYQCIYCHHPYLMINDTGYVFILSYFKSTKPHFTEITTSCHTNLSSLLPRALNGLVKHSICKFNKNITLPFISALNHHRTKTIFLQFSSSSKQYFSFFSHHFQHGI